MCPPDTAHSPTKSERIHDVNTLGLVLIGVGVLIAVGGVVVIISGRRARAASPGTAMPSAQAGQHGDWAADGHGGQAPTGAATVVGALLTVVGVVLAVSGGAMSLLLSDEGSGRVGDEVVAVGADEGATPTADLAGPGTECGQVEPPAGRPGPVRVEEGQIGCDEAVAVVQKYYELPTDPEGGNTAPKEFDGWRCTTATAGSAAERGYGTSCRTADTHLVVPLVDGADGSERPEPAPAPRGDLGLATPMSHPSCDGRGIVVLYSAVTPGSYESEIQTALANNPGSSYLRTDQACPSLRSRDDNGNVIYAVYRQSGYSHAQLCSDVAAAPAGAYGRWLDVTSDPDQLVRC